MLFSTSAFYRVLFIKACSITWAFRKIICIKVKLQERTLSTAPAFNYCSTTKTIHSRNKIYILITFTAEILMSFYHSTSVEGYSNNICPSDSFTNDPHEPPSKWMLFELATRTFSIEEGRAASKSPHWKFGYFLSISQQGVSADIIQNSAIILCNIWIINI